MTKISLCLTTYNRSDMVIRAISQVLDHPMIDEIVIVDDCSDYEIYKDLCSKIDLLAGDNEKIVVHRNESNLDCYRNKHRSIELAKNDWCIIFDSDNVIDHSYIDKLIDLQPKTIYAPDFARPHFDYRHFGGLTIDKSNISSIINFKAYECLINTCNYVVNRTEYLEVWDGSIDPHTADTAYFNYCWLKAGNKIHVVEGMQYEHEVHDGSHYKNNNHKTGDFFEVVMEKIKQLS